jgi:hypothetical protein
MLFCPNCGTRVTPATASEAGAPEKDHADDAAAVPVAAEYESRGPRMYDAPDDIVPPITSPATVQLDSAPAASYTSTTSYTPAATPAAQPYYAPQTYAGSQPAALPTSNTAVISLIFGILSYVMLPVIGPIVAIIAGHMAKNEIQRSNGQLGGNGMATVGLVLGYVQIVLLLLLACAVMGFIVLAALSNA